MADITGDRCIVCGREPALYCENCDSGIDRRASGEPSDGEMLDWYFSQKRFTVSWSGLDRLGWYLHDHENYRYAELLGSFDSLRAAIRAAMRRDREKGESDGK